jgi:phage/plasmid-associated DNA primase
MMNETDDSDIKQTKWLKKLSGNDPIDFEQKYAKRTITERNYAKIWIVTNLLPEVPDKSEGWFDRPIIIEFPNKFDGKTDILATIPKQEYENLGLKCVNLLREIVRTRTIENEGTFESRKANYEAHSDPLQKFIDEMTEEEVNGSIWKFEFQETYEAWCDENNFKVLSKENLGRKMKAKGYINSKKESNWTTTEGKKAWWRAWEGLTWKKNIQVNGKLIRN